MGSGPISTCSVTGLHDINHAADVHVLLLQQKRKVYAGRRGLWEALDRPMASRPLEGVQVEEGGRGRGVLQKTVSTLHWDGLS